MAHSCDGSVQRIERAIEERPMAKKKDALDNGETFVVREATILPITVNKITTPHVSFMGEAPEEGEKIIVVLHNGAAYTGVAHEVISSEGEVMIQMRDGLKPLPKE